MSLAAAIAATSVAGWVLPLHVRETPVGAGPCWSLEEADGTLVALVGTEADANLIAAALNHVFGADLQGPA